MINPVDQSGGFGGFRGCVLARVANIFPPEEGVCLFASGGWQTRQTRKPGEAVLVAVGGTLSLLMSGAYDRVHPNTCRPLTSAVCLPREPAVSSTHHPRSPT